MFPETAKSSVERVEAGAETELSRLMARYQAGEPGAVDELVRRLSPRLLPFLAMPRTNRADAEDLLQECWMRIHRSRHSYRSGEPVLPWIFAIARHTRLDGYRRKRRRESREVLVATPPDHWTTQNGTTKANEDRFIQMLETLPESQREVLVMLKVSGMSLEDVARATSSTVGAIKQKAHRAYKTLRLRLEEAGL